MNIILGQSNIDAIRAEISKLEDAQVFDQRAWAVVLMALSNSPCRRADAVRRMETAKGNQRPQVVHVRTDLGFPGQVIEFDLVRVAMETEA